MIFLRKPSAESLRRILESQASLAFTYPNVGTTRTNAPPAGFVLDHTRALLGEGAAKFDHACIALRRWRQFQFGWLEAFPTDTPLRAGETVIVLARVLGLWWTNAARIVYTIDEPGEPVARFGFAYGTLPGHVESGEERFLIEWDSQTDQVWYDIRAFSQPRHILTRIGRLQARAMQKRFASESASAMKAIVAGSGRDEATI
jgi:uncharacterized protein (UPF0548 family)